MLGRLSSWAAHQAWFILRVSCAPLNSCTRNCPMGQLGDLWCDMPTLESPQTSKTRPAPRDHQAYSSPSCPTKLPKPPKPLKNFCKTIPRSSGPSISYTGDFRKQAQTRNHSMAVPHRMGGQDFDKDGSVSSVFSGPEEGAADGTLRPRSRPSPQGAWPWP